MSFAGWKIDELSGRGILRRCCSHQRPDGTRGEICATQFPPLILSELAELECRRAFVLRTGLPNSENWNRLQAFLADGTWQREPIHWKALSERSEQFIDRFGARLKAGTLDTLHVAQALLSGCSWFLSFDANSNARILAASCRLRVFPALSSAEKGRVVR